MNFNHEKDASRKPVIHQCGGTLIHLDSGFEGKTNLVVTAAHCFCSLMWSRPGDKENSIIRKNIFYWNFNSKLNKQSNTAEFCSKIQDNLYKIILYKIILVDNSWSFGAFKLTDLGQWKNINIYFYYNGPTVSFLFYDFQNFSNVLKNNHYIATNAEECRKNNGPECLRQPKSGHFFIRVGSIDNTANLNLKVAEKNGQVNRTTWNFSIEFLFRV